MSDLNQKYDKILLELKKNINDEKEYEFVKNKFSELAMMFIDSMDKLMEIENRQKKMDKKLAVMQDVLEKIEDDIYIDDDDEEDDDDCDCDCGCNMKHDEECEFEIVCPYCDNEFIADNDFTDKDEIECPKCHNIIELDWDDECCDGECECCGSQCSHDEEKISDNSVAENSSEYKLDKSSNKDNNSKENNSDNKSKENNEKKPNDNKNEDDM